MSGPAELAKGWLRKADSDLATVRQVVSGDGPYDTACFHSQQAIEKSLKAVLGFLGEPIPRTHNLEELASCATGVLPALALDAGARAEITPFAVELRCDPGFWPDRETAAAALAKAVEVRSQAAALLPEDARP